jgi:predicted kinase
MIVFIINGAPRTGKDTFIHLVKEVSKAKVISYSSIDWVKEMAKKLGWDGVKDAKGRAFLSDLKDACTKYADIPFQKITQLLNIYKTVTHNAPKYFCTNVREPEEIQKLVNWCEAQGVSCYTIWVRKLSAEIAASETAMNHADANYMEYGYDWILHNEGTIEEFKHNITFRLNRIKEVIF